MKTLGRQSLFDIALQECGSVEGAISIAELNDVILTDELESGTELEIDSVLDKTVSKYYTLNEINPATAIDLVIPTGGIGYMAVQVDFIVSEDE